MSDTHILFIYLFSVVVYAAYLQRASILRKRHPPRGSRRAAHEMSYAEILLEIPFSLLIAMMWPVGLVLAPVAALLPKRAGKRSAEGDRSPVDRLITPTGDVADGSPHDGRHLERDE